MSESDGIQSRFLPEAFKVRMSDLLGEQYQAFMSSYDKPRVYGLRINTMKCSKDQFLKLTSLELSPIPWASSGFYYEEDSRPGKHPHYHAGLYYIQEPSAMAPVELLDVQPGERILDLCAAPGGKSTQIAAKLAGQGMLVTNDIHSDRVKALVKNIELSGVRNAVVLNEQPEKLKHSFVQFFDKILIDAPCSGEGMFRKEADMAKAWESDWVERYAVMQRELLDQAAHMLRPGGRMIYSTCTFSLEENEAMIAEFLDKHPAFIVAPVAAVDGLSHGYDTDLSGQLDSFSDRAREAVKGTVRLWPHLLVGEGHFVAVLLHNGSADDSAHIDMNLHSAAAPSIIKPNKSAKSMKSKHLNSSHTGKQPEIDLQLLYSFMAEHAPEVGISQITLHGEHVYASPIGLPDLSGIRIIRPGWYIGTLKKQRFEPSHALAMGLRSEDVIRTIDLEATSAAASRYLKGETLEVAESAVRRRHESTAFKGYCLVLIDGFPVGWGKWQDGMLKNEYPPGWRLT